MTAQIVPLAAMTHDLPTPGRALAVSEDGDAELIVLHDEETEDLVHNACDALVLLLCDSDADAEGVPACVDFRRARDLLAWEVSRARGGAVHLTSVYLYLAQVARPASAERIVCALEERLRLLGVAAHAPDGVTREAARARRTRAPRRTTRLPRRSRRPMGTRSVGLLFALFGV